MRKINPADPMQGSEPSWSDQDSSNEKLDIIKTFNWYNYNCNRKDAREFVIDYLKKIGRNREEVNSIKSLHETIFPAQFGWLSRMISLGFIPSEKTKTYFTTTYRKVLSEVDKEVAVAVVDTAPTNTISIQQRIVEKAGVESGELDGLIDDFVISRCKKEIDMESYFKSRKLSSVVLKKICDTYIVRGAEISEVITSKDAQTIEGYSNFTKPELRRLKEFIDTIVATANKGSMENKPTRKARKVKEKPASVVVAKVQYMKDFAELNLKSVLPEKIVGASQVWLYNTKTKLLGMYNADNAKGLTVKGTTVQNFNIETSSGKRLRKPEVTVKQVLDGGKIVLKKLLDGLTTKPAELTGRINSDTIVVRVITG